MLLELGINAVREIRRKWPINDDTGAARAGWAVRVSPDQNRVQFYNTAGVYPYVVDWRYAVAHNLKERPTETIVREFLESQQAHAIIRKYLIAEFYDAPPAPRGSAPRRADAYDNLASLAAIGVYIASYGPAEVFNARVGAARAAAYGGAALGSAAALALSGRRAAFRAATTATYAAARGTRQGVRAYDDIVFNRRRKQVRRDFRRTGRYIATNEYKPAAPIQPVSTSRVSPRALENIAYMRDLTVLPEGTPNDPDLFGDRPLVSEAEAVRARRQGIQRRQQYRQRQQRRRRP